MAVKKQKFVDKAYLREFFKNSVKEMPLVTGYCGIEGTEDNTIVGAINELNSRPIGQILLTNEGLPTTGAKKNVIYLKPKTGTHTLGDAYDEYINVGTEDSPVWESLKGGGGDAFSPTANVVKTGNKSTITITDKDGTTTVDVLDGESGVYVGDEIPADDSKYNVWVDTDDEPIATKSFTIIYEDDTQEVLNLFCDN